MSNFSIAGVQFSPADLTWAALAAAGIVVFGYLITTLPIG